MTPLSLSLLQTRELGFHTHQSLATGNPQGHNLPGTSASQQVWAEHLQQPKSRSMKKTPGAQYLHQSSCSSNQLQGSLFASPMDWFLGNSLQLSSFHPIRTQQAVVCQELPGLPQLSPVVTLKVLPILPDEAALPSFSSSGFPSFQSCYCNIMSHKDNSSILTQ